MISQTATVKLQLYVAAAGALLALAVATGRPELAALAAPLAVAPVLGLSAVQRPAPRLELRLSAARLLEGEAVTAEVIVESDTAIPRFEVGVALSDRLRPVGGHRAQVLAVPAGVPVVVEVAIEVDRWGAHRVGPVAWRAHDAAGLCRFESVAGGALALRVYPRRETLRSLAPPADTQVFAGNRPARVRGAGIEFAELRPFVSGDRVREVNWRAAARGLGLWVNERHPERNSDVVVFLDTFAEASLGRAVRAAAALVEAYGAERDRIGLIDFGGSLRWVRPGSGLGHLYRITEALIDTQVYVSYAWRGIGAVPARTLPAKALVLALSPLDDDRALAALTDLHRRGIDLAVIEVSPDAASASPAGELDALGWRIWLLEREVRRNRFRRLGVPVVEWTQERPLAAVIEEVSAFRRRGRRRAG